MSSLRTNREGALAQAEQLGTRWTRYVSWQARQSRMVRIMLRLAALLICMLLLSRGSGGIASVAWILALILSFVLAPLLLFVLIQWASRRVLWKVRNRLVATYLLMGFAPIVLLVTLTGIAAYLFAGQFATSAAIYALDGISFEVRDEAGSVAMLSLHQTSSTDSVAFNLKKTSPEADDISLVLLENGAWRALPYLTTKGQREASPFDGQMLPSWLHSGFHGIILTGGRLYLCSEVRVQEDSRTADVLGSLPLNGKTLRHIAQDLGYISLHPGFSVHPDLKSYEKAGLGASTHTPRPPLPNADGTVTHTPAPFTASTAPDGSATLSASPASTAAGKPPPELNNPEDFTWVGAGELPAARHFYDTRVLFTAPLPVFGWEDGKQVSAMVSVVSRPTLLYARLFATSVRIGHAVSVGLIVIALLFGAVELVALLLAMRLSRTITRSVAELYQGTLEIDRGNLAHRVHVGKHDQLGVLAASFNNMAGSLDTLLEQQREQQRLLSELAIAQEVQKNLFPQSPITLQGLELHAVCLPARSVSGDYFDFIFGRGNTLCIALGDISGKGISAALLMASLHSAVRAFSLGAEAASNPRPASWPPALPAGSPVGTSPVAASIFAAAPIVNPPYPAGAEASSFVLDSAGNPARSPTAIKAAAAASSTPGDGSQSDPPLVTATDAPPLEHCVPAEEHSGPIPSPAHLLELLNHHLYASTPPEKYATLFLAFYDKRTRRLTYSNGGHLPPFILHGDGTTRRLDCGGSVVGLLDGLSYLEDTVELNPGDLLFAYSDGLTEPENGKEEEFGEARLLETIRAHKDEALPSLAAVTLERLQRWIGDREQPDDMTLLLARQH